MTPGQCYLPDDVSDLGLGGAALRASLQEKLGHGRSRRSAGACAVVGARSGGRMLLLNPLHAPMPTLPQQASPYYPSSRLFRNPLYLRIEDVPGAAIEGACAARRSGRFAIGRAPHRSRRSLRPQAARARKAVQVVSRIAWSFDAYCENEGPLLQRYATFCALAERYGNNWRKWPRGYRHPDRPSSRVTAKPTRSASCSTNGYSGSSMNNSGVPAKSCRSSAISRSAWIPAGPMDGSGRISSPKEWK